MSRSRLTGLQRLRDLKSHGEFIAVDMAEGRQRFARLADAESAPRVVSSFNLFQTPEPLAAKLAGMFPAFGRTLEPSAGLGRLYKAVRALSDCPMMLVDISPECCSELDRIADENATVQMGDFLAMDAGTLGLFDGVIMNPPFKMGADVKHIRHALELLNPSGRLVAICANGPRQHEQLQPLASEWIDLPAGSFKEQGTNVNAAIVVIDA